MVGGRRMRFLAVLPMALLVGCTATMKYHMAAHQVHAAADGNEWYVQQCRVGGGVDKVAVGSDALAAAESDCILAVASESVIEDCAAAQGKKTTVIPTVR